MLRLIDGWDYLNTGAQGAVFTGMGWSGDVTQLIPDATVTRFGYGNSLKLQPSGGGTVYRAMPGGNLCESGAKSYVGNAIRIVSGSDTIVSYSLVEALSGVTHLTVTFSPTMGVLRVRRGTSAGTILAEIGPGAFDYDQWFYLEFGASILDAAGYAEIRINNVTVVSLPSVDTQNGGNPYWNVLMYVWGGTSPTTYIDDHYVCDDTGGVNDNFLGNSRAKALLAVGAGSSTQWDRSNTGLANWQNAINKAINDTLYVYTPTIGEQDLYTVNPIVNAPNVFGVSVKGAYRQDDATQRYIKNTLKSGATTVQGSLYATYQTYTFKEDVWDVNPDTGVAFTGAEVNALEIGPYLDS